MSTQTTAASYHAFARLTLREVGLWGAAAATVVTSCLVAAGVYLASAPEKPAAEATEQAVMIELAPIPISQVQSVAAAAAPAASEPEILEPVEQPTTAPEEPVEAVRPEDTPEPEIEKTPEVLTESEVSLTRPQPRPAIKRRVVAQQVPKDQPTRRQPQRQQPTQQAASDASPSSQGGASTAPRIDPADWHARVIAWMNRHKRYPAAARSRREEGTVEVTFVIDPSGRVLSAQVAKSSGRQPLDQAALDMVRRSSPVPAPPAQIARNALSLTIPVGFRLR